VYAVVAALVVAEDALFIGLVIPGETAAILGGVAASQGHVSLSVMIAVVVLAAIVGDSVGYEMGRRFGPRLLDSRLVRSRRDRLDQVRARMARRGGAAVFLARFVAFLRAATPAVAGSASMPYPTFLAYNVAGGVVWGSGTVFTGYLAGTSYRTVEHALGRGTAIAVGAVGVALAIAWAVRRRRRSRSAGGGGRGQLGEQPRGDHPAHPGGGEM
jgi:membrane protein DedA with SNARE-associated domain